MVEQKQKNLNLRLSESEKADLEQRAKSADKKLSEYVRSVLFADGSQSDTKEKQSETVESQQNDDVIQVLNERISDLKAEIERTEEKYTALSTLFQNQQMVLMSKENRLLELEHDSKKSWWKFWK